MTTTFNASELSQFTGCMQPFKDGFFQGIIYTDGVKFLRDNGCNWLVVDVLSTAVLDPAVKDQEFVTVKVNKDGAYISFIGIDDEGEEVEVKRMDQYFGFDVPCDITLFVSDTYQQSGPVKMLMLGSEY
jgi:hypothetical protein